LSGSESKAPGFAGGYLLVAGWQDRRMPRHDQTNKYRQKGQHRRSREAANLHRGCTARRRWWGEPYNLETVLPIDYDPVQANSWQVSLSWK
jgi:hypothetical protein